jgi:iron complex outermembrane receptor protein
VNNVSPQARLLGIPHLNPEKSDNITLGIGTRPTKNFSLTLDYYNITVKDRIVLSNNIKPSGVASATLDQILAANNIVSLNFFANALDSRTSGLDMVANYKNISIGAGTLAFTLSGNYTLQNERIGAVKNPKVIVDANNADNNPANDQTLVNATQEALMFTSRPQYKPILGINYDIKKFGFVLGNTVFGPTKFRNEGMDENLQVVFKTKMVTDLGIYFQASEKITIAFNINNIFNILPEWKMVALNQKGKDLLNDQTPNLAYYGLTPKEMQSNLIYFNQRYSMVTYDGSHFSQLGTMFNLALSFKL